MNRGTIILTPFPFTDLQGNKVRPAIVVSSKLRKDTDVIVAFISSVIDWDKIQNTDYIISNEDIDFVNTGLKTVSIIKADKLATIERSIILGELGYLSPDSMKKVDDKLKIALDLKTS